MNQNNAHWKGLSKIWEKRDAKNASHGGIITRIHKTKISIGFNLLAKVSVFSDVNLDKFIFGQMGLHFQKHFRSQFKSFFHKEIGLPQRGEIDRKIFLQTWLINKTWILKLKIKQHFCVCLRYFRANCFGSCWLC